ncbi:unnamed protein product [Closterium sp. NIES-54]
MTLRPSTAPQHVPLPSPPASSLPTGPDPASDIVSGMWIFRVKRPPGSPPVFKARYVARGFRQRQGADFFHTFSSTPKMTTLRVLLHVAAQRDYELHSLDFTTAFLQGSLHEEIWMRRPPGSTGLFPADDLVFATADTEALAHVKSELQKRHTCTDLGELTSCLGLRITRDRAQRTITLTQSHMVQQVLQRFGFTYSSPQSTPLPITHSLSASPSDESVELSGPYPELVGCLMYLMTCTRPDLAYPLSLLARYVAPGRHQKVHWDAAKRVLRYLCSTSGMGLVLGGRARVILTGHADTSWVDDLATQRSSQGYTFSLGSDSVSWRSTRSSSVLSSSCEAERGASFSSSSGMCRLEFRGSFILLVAYVDDLLYTGDNLELLNRFESDYKQKLEVTVNQNVTHFLGLNVTQLADTIHLSVAKYAETLAKYFGITPVNLTTPFCVPPSNHKPDTTPLSAADHRLYQQ